MDQGSDHETKAEFGLEEAAERLLAAVADGLPESVELARKLVAAVLEEPLVKRALVLDKLLRDRSPLALVRAVELAEHALVNRSARSFSSGFAEMILPRRP